jgi:hypothetical protein
LVVLAAEDADRTHLRDAACILATAIHGRHVAAVCIA